MFFLNQEAKLKKLIEKLEYHIKDVPEDVRNHSYIAQSIQNIIDESHSGDMSLPAIREEAKTALYYLIEAKNKTYDNPNHLHKPSQYFVDVPHIYETVSDRIQRGAAGLLQLIFLPITAVYYAITASNAPQAMFDNIFYPVLDFIVMIIYPLGLLVSKYETDSYDIYEPKLLRMLKSIEALTEAAPELSTDEKTYSDAQTDFSDSDSDDDVEIPYL